MYLVRKLIWVPADSRDLGRYRPTTRPSAGVVSRDIAMYKAPDDFVYNGFGGAIPVDHQIRGGQQRGERGPIDRSIEPWSPVEGGSIQGRYLRTPAGSGNRVFRSPETDLCFFKEILKISPDYPTNPLGSHRPRHRHSQSPSQYAAHCTLYSRQFTMYMVHAMRQPSQGGPSNRIVRCATYMVPKKGSVVHNSKMLCLLTFKALHDSVATGEEIAAIHTAR